MNQKVDCHTVSTGIKRLAGWVFADLFSHYFGEGTVVLRDEDGKELEFSVTGDWLERNRASNHGMNDEIAHAFDAHIEGCPSPECVEAKRRLVEVNGYFRQGKLPGGASVAIVSACESRRLGARVVLSTQNGFDKAVKGMTPFFLWFSNEPDFWS